MPEQVLARIEALVTDMSSQITSLREEVQEDLKKERSHRRNGFIIIGVGALIVVGCLIGAFFILDQVQDNAEVNSALIQRIDRDADTEKVENCKINNRSRVIVRETMEVLLTELVAGREADPEVQERLARLNANLDQVTRLEEC